MDKQRIQLLIYKLQALVHQDTHQAIDYDLMLDYTRVIYADLLEMKAGIAPNSKIKNIEEKKFTDTSKPVVEEKSIVLEMPPNIATKEEMAPTVTEEEVKVDASMAEMKKMETTDLKENKEMPLPSVIQKDIRKYFGINDKYLYINELFHNDTFDYETVLDYINGNTNYDKTIQWIESEYFNTNKWKRDDATVEDFLQVVKRFYS